MEYLLGLVAFIWVVKTIMKEEKSSVSFKEEAENKCLEDREHAQEEMVTLWNEWLSLNNVESKSVDNRTEFDYETFESLLDSKAIDHTAWKQNCQKLAKSIINGRTVFLDECDNPLSESERVLGERILKSVDDFYDRAGIECRNVLSHIRKLEIAAAKVELNLISKAANSTNYRANTGAASDLLLSREIQLKTSEARLKIQKINSNLHWIKDLEKLVAFKQ